MDPKKKMIEKGQMIKAKNITYVLDGKINKRFFISDLNPKERKRSRTRLLRPGTW